jgi:hypothetical protein
MAQENGDITWTISIHASLLSEQISWIFGLEFEDLIGFPRSEQRSSLSGMPQGFQGENKPAGSRTR